jgi:hypothetical protein
MVEESSHGALHWRAAVGENGRHRWDVAGEVADRPHQFENCLLALCYTVEVAHSGNIAEAQTPV